MTEVEEIEKPGPDANGYYTILLNDFIRQVCDGTVDPLIYEEFANAIKDKEQAYILRLIKEINMLETNFNMVQLIVKRIAAHDVVDEADIICNGLLTKEDLWKRLGNLLPVRPTDTLATVVTRSKALYMDMQAKKKELDRIMPKSEEGSKMDRKYFSRLITEVEKHFHIQIDREKKYLCDFVELVKDMKEAFDNMRRDLKKK